jgi:aspartate aminotransferase
MPASPIRRLVPYAEEAKRKGRTVYHLNIGQPDIPSPDVALEAVRSLPDRVIEYSHSAGNESYRRKLAAFYQGLGIPVEYTDMLVTTGGSEAITFALMSTADPGDEVIVPEPFYANYNGFSVSAGVNVVPITSGIENGFALPPMEEFEKRISPRTRGIIICNPNNPTGYLYSEKELELGEHHFSAMHLKGLEEHVIMFDSVSKRYSMCGVRVGALVSRNRHVIQTALKFAQARLSPPSYGQVAGEAALDTPPSYFKEVYEEYIQRRDFMVRALNDMPGVICPTPKGAFYTVVHLPVDDADAFAQWILSDFSYQNQTVMMAPASGFYSSPRLGKQEVRIAYVLKKEDLEKAMETLAEALKAYPGKTV